MANIEIEITDKASKPLDKIGKSANKTAKELLSAARAAQDTEKGLDDAGNSADKMGNEFEKAEKKTKNLSKSMKTLKSFALKSALTLAAAAAAAASFGIRANSELEKLRGTTDQLSTSLTSSWNAIKALAAATSKPMYDALITGIQKFDNWLRKNGATAAYWGAYLAQSVLNIPGAFNTLMIKGFYYMKEMWAKIKGVFAEGMIAIYKMFGTLGDKLSGMMNELNEQLNVGLAFFGQDTLSTNIDLGWGTEGVTEWKNAAIDATAEVEAARALSAYKIKEYETKSAEEAGEAAKKGYLANLKTFDKAEKDKTKVAVKHAKKREKAVAKVKKAEGKKANDGLWKSLAKNHQSNLDLMAKQQAQSWQEIGGMIKMALSDAFMSIMDGDFKGAMEGVFSFLKSILADYVADAIVQLGKVQIEAAIAAIARAASETTWVGLAAMTAAMVGLGIAVGGSGGRGGGGSSAPSMPSYGSVSGGTYSNGGTVDYAGSAITVTQYNEILKIARINQSDFNGAVIEYNNLQKEAAEISTKATYSLRKWNIEIGNNYNAAMDAVKSGALDNLDSFFDSFASQGDKLDYARRQTEALYRQIGMEVPASMEAATEAVKYWLAMYNAATNDVLKNTYLLNASKAAEAGSALGEYQGIQSDMASSMQSAADDAKAAAEAWADTLVDIAGLKADWIGGTKGANLYLDAVIKRTGLSGITSDNFLEKFTAASRGGMEGDQFSKWSDLSSALNGLTDAIEEELSIEIGKLNTELSHFENIFKLINSAWTGKLSYLNSVEKASKAAEQAELLFNQGDTSGYFTKLSEQLEYEKRMSITKEEYIPKFDSYIRELKESKPEKTTDDVVETLESINDKIDNIEDAIEKASYQGAL